MYFFSLLSVLTLSCLSLSLSASRLCTNSQLPLSFSLGTQLLSSDQSFFLSSPSPPEASIWPFFLWASDPSFSQSPPEASIWAFFLWAFFLWAFDPSFSPSPPEASILLLKARRRFRVGGVDCVVGFVLILGCWIVLLGCVDSGLLGLFF